MIRRIIEIDQKKCNGCGLCVKACHEGAIALIDGKAVLTRDDYCDGLGDCLPNCPVGAISFVEREAAAYDEAAVQAHLALRSASEKACDCSSSQEEAPAFHGCPGAMARTMSPKAAYFQNCDLLIAADCTAYAYGNFHADFIKDRVCLIACPQLDDTDYSHKLAEIFSANNIRSITLTRMTVPCCGGLVRMVENALQMAGVDIPLNIVTISPDGKIL